MRVASRHFVASFVGSLSLLAASACGANLPRTTAATVSTPITTGSQGRVPEPNAVTLSAPPVWQWLPIAGSECADGSATGIGVSLAANSNLLMIFLQGGGRCDSADTCGVNDAAAVNLQGFAADDFNSTIAVQSGILNRQDPNNPLAQASMVFVPYCTGDDHSGDNIASYGTHHRGYANMGLYLQTLVPMFPHVQEVLLTGSSAGGSGAFWNYYRAQQSFGAIQVTLLDDAGPFIGQPVNEISDAAVTEWALAKTVPAGCNACLPGNAPAGVQNFYPFFLKAMPKHRGALLTSDQDAHVAQRDVLTGPQFAAALSTLADKVASTDPQFKFFYIPSAQHTWLGGVNGSIDGVVAQDVRLSTFVQQMLSNDANWANVR